MSYYADHSFKFDSLVMDGVRYLVTRPRGTAVAAGFRDTSHVVGWRHGLYDETDPYLDAKYMGLRIEVHAVGADGGRTANPYAHLRKNWADLIAVLKKRGKIDVRQFIDADPDESESSDEPVELQGYARSMQVIELTDDSNPLVWALEVELRFAYPWWHELPKVELTAGTSHQVVTDDAPIADPVFVFSGDGTLTDNLTLGHSIGIVGSSGAVTVDVGKKEVYEGGELAMGLLRLGDDAPEHWLEWPANTTVDVSSTVNVAVEYFVARQ